MKIEALERVIKHYGSQRNLARGLGVTDGAVSQWVAQGYFPPAQAIRIEIATGIRAVALVKPE